MDDSTTLLVAVVAAALAFDFTNGFHDTANAMATSIATKALRPKAAVLLCGVLNFAGAFLSIKVAATIAEGIVDAQVLSLSVIFAGLLGAIAWNVATWAIGLPSSSSHALIGGIVGATWVAVGSSAVKGSGIVEKVLIPAVLAPIICGGVALLGTVVAYRMQAGGPDATVRRGYRHGQVATASLVALAHGTNDAQKTMGVITLALIAHGSLDAGNFAVPFWVKASAALAISLGTAIGGWRIIRTMGTRLTEIEAPQGFVAEATAASTILASTSFGYSLSTTHVVSGGIIGVGLGKRLAEVRWSIAGRMVVAWVLTLPAAALVGAGADQLARALGGGTAGVLVVGLIVAAAVGAIFFVVHRRDPVGAGDGLVIDVGALAKILLVAVIGGVGLTALYGAGLGSAARASVARRDGGRVAVLDVATIAVAALACVAAVAIGFYALTRK